MGGILFVFVEPLLIEGITSSSSLLRKIPYKFLTAIILAVLFFSMSEIYLFIGFFGDSYSSLYVFISELFLFKLIF